MYLHIELGERKRVHFNYSECAPTISETMYPHILPKHEVSCDELNNALDIIIRKFMQDELYGLSIDIDDRNNRLAPAKEMTISEIEKELGYKVKIVKENEDD